MPIMVKEEKWILYKHTSNYELITAVALDIKNKCSSEIGENSRHRIQERLTALSLYKSRNPKKPLDSINHRINTLEFFLFGYEDTNKRFIFSPLGNLFLKYVNDPKKQQKVFLSMLLGIQFEHPANGTPSSFQIYPFRLLFKLMMDERLDFRLYSTEYAYLVALVKNISLEKYDDLVKKILEFRCLSDANKMEKLKLNEHTNVNCIYEWQYYTQKLLNSIALLEITEGKEIGRLYHPRKTNSKSKQTPRVVKNGYAAIKNTIKPFVSLMLRTYSPFDLTLKLNDPNRMQLDIIKEIYSFYPKELLIELGESNHEIHLKLLELPKLITEYSNNPENHKAYLFEDVLAEAMNMFVNVQAQKVGGAGSTDIECLYTSHKKKFAIEAKSTANKLTMINVSRLREHRNQIGGEYTIVITSRYVPAAGRDINDDSVVIILASTFSEYIYNHLYHDSRDLDFKDFDEIIVKNLGKDISELISNLTMEKFATQKNIDIT